MYLTGWRFDLGHQWQRVSSFIRSGVRFLEEEFTLIFNVRLITVADANQVLVLYACMCLAMKQPPPEGALLQKVEGVLKANSTRAAQNPSAMEHKKQLRHVHSVLPAHSSVAVRVVFRPS